MPAHEYDLEALEHVECEGGFTIKNTICINDAKLVAERNMT